jgi:anti-anti-sigma factor
LGAIEDARVMESRRARRERKEFRMRLTMRRVNGISVLSVEGELTVASALPFLRQARHIMAGDPSPRVAVDLSQLRRIDSSGCAALLALRRDVQRPRGSICVCGLVPEVRLLLEVMQAHVIFDIEPDLAGAMELLSAQAGAGEGAGVSRWASFGVTRDPVERPIAS